MAGKGQRFIDKGIIAAPKAFLDVKGKPMIELVVDNLKLDAPHIFIMQESHLKDFGNVMNRIMDKKPNSTIVPINEITEGPACTCLKAKEYINNDIPLLYSNCDQYLDDWNPEEFLKYVGDYDGGLLTHRDTWSYSSFAVMDESCYVKRTVEKEVISDVSSTGIYYWSKGSDFVKYAESMVANNRRARNGEFYAINIYNEGIADGKKYVVYFLKRFWRIGIPSELDQFLKDNP